MQAQRRVLPHTARATYAVLSSSVPAVDTSWPCVRAWGLGSTPHGPARDLRLDMIVIVGIDPKPELFKRSGFSLRISDTFAILCAFATNNSISENNGAHTRSPSGRGGFHCHLRSKSRVSMVATNLAASERNAHVRIATQSRANEPSRMLIWMESSLRACHLDYTL
jgi:hypothetical protein